MALIGVSLATSTYVLMGLEAVAVLWFRPFTIQRLYRPR